MRLLNIKEYFKQEKDKLRQAALVPPSLKIIDATDGDIGNQIYIRKKVEDFQEMGWYVDVLVPEDDYELAKMCIMDGQYTGIIAQMPIAERFNTDTSHLIHPHLDVDGLGKDALVMPATVRGIIDYLDACGFEYEGKTAVVIGRSKIVGKPMAQALLARNMTVCQMHSRTPMNAKLHILPFADLIVTATGRPSSLFREDCKFDAIVVDVGISRGKKGKLTGDFIEALGNEEHSTPVPGGVGLLTRLGLMKNCVDLANDFAADQVMRIGDSTI